MKLSATTILKPKQQLQVNDDGGYVLQFYGRLLYAHELEAAYKQVARVKCAAGLDGQSFSDFVADLPSNLHRLLLELRGKTSSGRNTQIRRQYAIAWIPTVLDHIVQECC
jgi:RNA-directed DNA polymerase